MKYIVIVLGIALMVALCFIGHLKQQINSITRQLEKRLDDGARSSIYASLFDRSVTRLAANINRCFEADEIAKSTLEREEKNFRNTIANISHDLRTPLTSVKGYLQLLSATDMDDVQRARMRIIKKHTDELGDLIEHFFEYSCLLCDEPQLVPERFCLTDETAECLAAAVTQLEEKGLSVRLNQFEQVSILADREKTVRIIQNLVRNCIQHSAGEIAVSVTKTEDLARIEISNPVKNPEEIEVRRIFERFYTAEKSRRKSTGLGLSIVKLLAEQMGGSVSAWLNENLITISVTLQHAQ